MSTSSQNAGTHLELPADRFYWGVLDASALPRRARSTPEQLGYLFESVLPVAVDTIHAVYVPIGTDRVLACGFDRDDLHGHATQRWLTLSPDRVPGFISETLDEPIDPDRLNLLTTAFEPRQIKVHRRRTTLVGCAAILLCTGLILAGQSRRAARLLGHTRALESTTAELYDAVLPPSNSPLPPSARLTAELRLLDRTRGTASPETGPVEVAPSLAAMLASWPNDLHLTTDSLSASSTAITLSVRLPDEAAAERFERELRAPPGWSLRQPNVVRERDEIAVRVRMEPGVPP
ncbi:MAG: hypothetical protein HND58_04340 [Planctomycetota bacterium]|nr:MAG: hypothetical protein HND58_04340 [Planctomycetota bacterium]